MNLTAGSPKWRLLRDLGLVALAVAALILLIPDRAGAQTDPVEEEPTATTIVEPDPAVEPQPPSDGEGEPLQAPTAPIVAEPDANVGTDGGSTEDSALSIVVGAPKEPPEKV